MDVSDFHPVVGAGDWGYYETANGLRLYETWYDILMPDGAVLRKRIKIDKSSYDISDMGHPYTVVEYRAYFLDKFHGHPIKIYLKGLSVKRIKNEEDYA
jgi:hypothetical protein